ncbi:MAG: transglutaminase family protein [Candidatus Kapabacteria bacterium]|jgi:transglutaminase-like putative cysteine protease|nr:transglutaminase family protein [Candidatus Kapabacteria bacterium]
MMNVQELSPAPVLRGISAETPAATSIQRYRVLHTTEYEYKGTVNICQNEALLKPRSYSTPLLEQRCITSSLHITPRPDDERTHVDFFGNEVLYFALQKPHETLTVSATSILEKRSFAPLTDDFLSASEGWERVADLLRFPFTGLADTGLYENVLDAAQYVFPSAFAGISAELKEYALPSFLPERPLLEAVRDFVRRIYTDYKYVPGFTTISTPIATVLRERKGVCQDFAHLALGCLRSLGLAARYVSGYIETHPPEGKEKLVGADASHAWIAVFEPHLGWVEFDPTNNQLVRWQHLTVGWGRDYADVAPMKGVMLSAASAELDVSVDVARLVG